MGSPYTDIQKLNKDLKDYSWIGGWSKDNDVFLWRRNENGERVIRVLNDVPRYFCIKKKDYDKLPKSTWDNFKKRGLLDHGYFDGDYACLISKFTGYISDWNKWLQELHELNVEPLEGDINRLQRLFIDLELKVTNPNDIIKPKVCFWDIETDDSGGKINAGVDKILSVAIKDYYTGDEFFYINNDYNIESERKFLIEVLSKLISYDVCIGYNNFAFDDVCLEGRLAFHNIEKEKWNRICSIDLYNQFERQGTFIDFNSKNKKLDTIAKAVIGRGKLDHKRKTFDLWSNDRELLKEYNLEDIRLLFDMEQKLNTANLVMSMMSFSGLPYNFSHSPLRLVEGFLLRKAAEKRKAGILDYRFNTAYYLPEHNLMGKSSPFARNALPSDRRKGRQELLEEMGIDYEKIEGGYVMESKPSLSTNVASFDFQSLYPSVIIAHNICFSTLIDKDLDVPKNCTPNDTYFRTDFTGLMPDAIEFLLSERRRIRAEMKNETDQSRITGLDILQKSIKILTNSFFGVTGLWGSRLYSEKLGNAITSFGRFALPLGEEYFNAGERKVIIQDTDSMYLCLKDGDNPEELKNKYIKVLRQTIKSKFNTYKPDVLEMTWEKIYKSILVVEKKMYAGFISYKDGKYLDIPVLDIKGLKLKKSDTCKWASEIGKNILIDILSNKYTYDHFWRKLEIAKDDLCENKVSLEELRISARLGKEFNEYKNNNLIYVTIAQRMIEKGFLVSSHSTINYYVGDGNTPMQGTGDEEISNSVEIDAVYYFNKQLLKMVSPMLEIVFPEVDWTKLEFPRKLKKTGYFEKKVIYEKEVLLS